MNSNLVIGQIRVFKNKFEKLFFLLDIIKGIMYIISSQRLNDRVVMSL